MGRRLKASDPSKTERPKAGPVTTTRMANERVWQTALLVAGGKLERIEVKSFGQVEVRVP
jgi:hypothetical protein